MKGNWGASPDAEHTTVGAISVNIKIPRCGIYWLARKDMGPLYIDEKQNCIDVRHFFASSTLTSRLSTLDSHLLTLELLEPFQLFDL
jgi:hypothetical protein